jgi:hypothetical protein
MALPAGRYYLLGTVNDPRFSAGTTSPFTVVEGTDISCLGAYAVAGSSSASMSSTRSSTSGKASSTAGSAATASSRVSGGSGVGTGALAGIVVGALAVLAIAAGILFVCLRRKRRQERENATSDLPDMRRSTHGSTSLFERFTPPLGKNRSTSHTRLPSGRDPIALTSIGGSSQSSHEGNGLNEKNVVRSPDISLPATPTVLAGGGIREEGGNNPFETPRLESTGQVQQAGEFGILGNGASGSGSGSGSGAQRDRSQSQGGAGIGRSTSTRRKPVPSLGAELRNQMGMEKEGQEVMLGSLTPPELGEKRGSFSLMPDPPVMPK